VTPEEQETTLIMQRDHLPTLELGHGMEHRSEHPSNRVSQPRHEVVQHQEVSRQPGMTLRFTGVSGRL